MSSHEKDPLDPSTTSMAWDSMIPIWDMIDTILGGTGPMRDAATTYLPQHEQESMPNYQERLGRCTLFNMTELTLGTWVGKPFSDPVKLNEDVPKEIVNISNDIDLRGNNMTVVARDWFRESLAKSFSHILIDMPALTDDERNGRTLADDNRDNIRPYWVLIKPENLIFAESQIINGREMLTHVRILETIIDRDGFAESVTEQIRILEPGWFEIWEKEFTNKSRTRFKWVRVQSDFTDLDEIPLVTFYANRTGLMEGKPPLEDLAHLNIRHWQSTSDQINILTVSRFPMLAVSGATDQSGDTMVIGPRQLLGTKDAQGRFYYVEHSGKAIKSGREDLEDLEEQMASYGAEFLKRKSGSHTATGRALDSSEAMSPLQDMVIRFTESMGEALDITAKWLKLERDGGTVDIATDFSISGQDDAELKILLEARKNGDISMIDFLNELKLRGILSDDFDVTQNISRILVGLGLGLETSNPKNEDE